MPINPPFRQSDIPIVPQNIAPNMPPHNIMPANFAMQGQYNSGVGFNRVMHRNN
jgi:hypothetical protein